MDFNDNDKENNKLIFDNYVKWYKDIPYLYKSLYVKVLDYNSPCINWINENNFIISNIHINGDTDSFVPSLYLINYNDTKEDKETDNVSIVEKLPINSIDFIKNFKYYNEINKLFVLGNNKNIKIFNLENINDKNINISEDSNYLFNFSNVESYEITTFDYNKNTNSIAVGCNNGLITQENIENFKLNCDGNNCDTETNNKNLNSSTNLYHKGIVTCLKWHLNTNDILFSSGEDRVINIIDCRNKKPVIVFEAHTEEVTSLDINPYFEYSIASSSENGEISIWDLRYLNKSAINIYSIKERINKVEYSKNIKDLIISSSANRDICLWDISKVNNSIYNIDQVKNSQNEFMYDNEYSLKFLHKGHVSDIYDFSERPIISRNSIDFSCASLSNNILQIWSPFNYYIKK